MDKKAIKDITYGGLTEILKDRKMYYYSSVGPDYCHLTEEGEKVISEYINMIAYKIMKAEEDDLTKRAKELTMSALKWESS